MMTYDKWRFSDEGLGVLIKFNHEAKEGDHLEDWWKQEYIKRKYESKKEINNGK